MDIRRSVFVIIVVVFLLLSMVGMASAKNSQTWYMKNTASGATGANYEMEKGGGVGTSWLQIDSGVSKIWAADQSVAVDGGIDMGAVWTGNIYLYVTKLNDAGASLQVKIGVLSSGGSFTPKGSISESWSTGASGGFKNMALSFTLDDLVLAKDEYLALELTSTHASNWVRIHTTGEDTSPSYITFPENDPAYPYPEVSTLLLTSVGMLMLGGFVVYSRRRNNK